MIVNIDVKALEVVCAAWLSNDSVLCQEILEGQDIHANNQKEFNLPSGEVGRFVAKRFVFRVLYGGTQYGFVKDSDFSHVSTNPKYWENVIERFYAKYKGIAKWHNDIIRTVGKTGKLTTPFGRTFEYGRKDDGSLPQAAIKNYIVQGSGADIVCIARVSFRKRLIKAGIKGQLINTVHDSIVADCPSSEVDKVVELSNGVFNDLPNNINKLFGVGFNLPIKGEISVGPNQADLKELA